MVDSVSLPKINGKLSAMVQRAFANRAYLARAATFRDSMLLMVLAGVWAFFYFATDGTFLTQRNLLLLALQTSIVSLAAISAVMLIVTRNFDLSGWIGRGFRRGHLLALLTVKYDVNPWISVIAAVSGGVAMGVWQGLWVARIGVSSFIVTLAGMLYFRGLSMIATNGATVAPLPDALTDLATGFLSPALSIGLIVVFLGGFLALRIFELNRARSLGLAPQFGADLFSATLPAAVAAVVAIWIVSRQGIPYLVLLVAICATAGELLMRRTRYGARLYAIGGNPEAARLSGINVKQVIFWNFVIAGFGYGITGVALTARVSGAIGGTAGLFLELDTRSHRGNHWRHIPFGAVAVASSAPCSREQYVAALPRYASFSYVLLPGASMGTP